MLRVPARAPGRPRPDRAVRRPLAPARATVCRAAGPAARPAPPRQTTSLSFPVATSNTNPRTWSVCGMNGLDRDPVDRLADVGVQVGERLGRPLGLQPGLVLDALLELVVGEGQHPAVGVVDEDDLLGAQQPLRDGQRADLVVGDHPTGVADHVRLALVQAEQAVDVQPGVHAGDDGDVLGRRQRERAGEGLGVAGVVGEQFVRDGHGDSWKLGRGRHRRSDRRRAGVGGPLQGTGDPVASGGRQTELVELHDATAGPERLQQHPQHVTSLARRSRQGKPRSRRAEIQQIRNSW